MSNEVMKKEATEIAVQKTGFLALGDFDLASAMAEEMDGLSVSFDRIKLPAGGMTVFEMPGDDPDNPETVKEFSAVILSQHPLRAYYKTQYTGGSNPPDCGSYDGVIGIPGENSGCVGGNCKTCPYNKFGSDGKKGKACKERRRLYLLKEGEIFPILFSLPTGSLQTFSKYIMKLLGKGYKSNSVVTRFTLKKATSSDGIAYSQAQFAIDRVLTKEEYALIDGLSNQVKMMQNSVAFEPDVEEAPENAPLVDPETGEIIEPLN